MSGIKINFLFLLIILTNLMTLNICEIDNEDITKAISCMSLISQKFEKEPDPKTYSSLMLKCFITITDVEAKEILVRIEQGMKSMEDEDIQKLIDIDSLKNISQNELEKQSLKLEKAIKAFQKMQENYSSNKKDKNYEDDDEYRKSLPSRGNFLGVIMKGMTGILKAANNIGTIIIIIIFVYFGQILYGKYCPSKKTNKKDDMAKEKDKNKKKKKKTQ